MKKNITLPISLILLLFLLIFLYPVWERAVGSWLILIHLAIPIVTLWIFIRIIIEVVRLFKRGNYRSVKNYRPLLILVAGILLIISVPYNIEDDLYGEVNFRACYEGTQNQATFKLRGDDRFEIHYTAAFFVNDFVTGQYRLKGDTLYLTYNGATDVRFGDKVYMDDSTQYLIPIRNDTLFHSRQNFYYGYCKGLN